MKRLVCGGLLSAILCATPALADAPLLANIFQDHAVLQRDTPIKVWGAAKPGSDVAVSIAGNSVTAHADANGDWQASLPALAAGGPFVLIAKSGSTEQDVKDVLVGDVWLCSGQSNMVLQVSRTLDSYSETQNGKNDSIRMLTVPLATSPVPMREFPQAPQWQPTTPQTIGNFSAACYYFARELQKTVKVPFGLVTSAWGGSKIRTWMSEPALRQNGGFNEGLDILALYAKDPVAGAPPFGAIWEAWWKAHAPGPLPWDPSTDVSAWAAAPTLGWWDDWGIPELVNRTGMVWYRTTVELAPADVAKGASLSIGQVDEIDATWVNGAFVGGGSGGNRTYRLPAGLLHPGTNVIAVNILNTYKQGGLLGPESAQGLHFDDGHTVPLTAKWNYALVPQTMPDPPRAPWESLAGLGMAYNAMVAPLGPYGLRGVLWYQGESDTGEPDAYRKQLTGLMADWRGQFQRDLPFFVVQLPDYGTPPLKPADSGWAKLREAQREAVADDKNAALIVTIDIGERFDVHPANKQEVGRRLALAARRLVYGEKLVASGPVAVHAVREGRRIAVRFDDVEKGLVTYSSEDPIGFELCGKTCSYASAQIARGEVHLAVPARTSPAWVRYCWADSPICTLYDGAGMPAAPFDLPIETGHKGVAMKLHTRHARR